jgi:hypothetical protein
VSAPACRHRQIVRGSCARQDAGQGYQATSIQRERGPSNLPSGMSTSPLVAEQPEGPVCKKPRTSPLEAVKAELCDADERARVASVDVQAVKSMDKSTRRALLMKFIRTREPATGVKSVRTEKCPDNIAQEINKCPLKRNHYFDLWVGCSQSWGKVVLFEKTYRKQTSRGSFKEVWMTRDQILNLCFICRHAYNCTHCLPPPPTRVPHKYACHAVFPGGSRGERSDAVPLLH